MSELHHIAVLAEEVLEHLAPRAGATFLDGTVGLGGHAAMLLERLRPGGTLLGLDVDAIMIARAESRLRPLARDVRLELRRGSYGDAGVFADELELDGFDGVLLDLGANSAQLDDPQRGFSFSGDNRLDMRFDLDQPRQALDLVNGLDETALADLIYQYGQEPASRKIAKKICQARRGARITTTGVLARLVESVVGPARPGRIHPATRTFQALRIAVNRELETIEAALPMLIGRLRRGGRIGVISFHSLEDGLVKRAFREAKARGELRELVKRPIGPTADEARRNRRSRSAKLRVGERL